MSLRPSPVPPVPEETARVAEAAFPKGNLYLRMRDTFEGFFADADFADLFSPRGRPAEAPWRLLLVCVLQYAEGLSDRQAADAVRRCLDWKYLLALPLTDPGFDASLLSDFRARLLEGRAEVRLLDQLLTQFRDQKLLKAHGTQRTDSTHVLAAIRTLNRLELLGETLRYALNTLAAQDPAWVAAHCPPEWAERYGRRVENARLPRRLSDRDRLAHTMGQDGLQLRTALDVPSTPAALRELPAVLLLAAVWRQQFYWEAGSDDADDGGRAAPPGALRWRTAPELPPVGVLIHSPYDPEAHYTCRDPHAWVGYRVHLTETCDPTAPRLITDVQTTPAPVPDVLALPRIQQSLAERGLRPATQLADAGYVDAEGLVTAQAYGVRLVGPPLPDVSWQAQAQEGFAAADFHLDWQEQRAYCPGGKTSVRWQESEVRGRAGRRPVQHLIRIDFSRKDCLPCPYRRQCTHGDRGARRLTLQPQAAQEALQATRAYAKTEAFRQEYQARNGIEATHEQGNRRCDLRHCRYRGLRKTHLQHLFTALALNFIRVGEWLLDKQPAPTRTSRLLAALATG